MDWATLISEILWMEEISEAQLGTRLTSPVTQSTINKLKRGCTRSPNYDLGHELIQRHKKLKKQNQAKQASVQLFQY